MEGKTVCFLVTLVVLFATRRGTTTEDSEFRETNLPSLLSSNEGSCIKSVPQCAGCLDHRTCQRCQEGFLLIESYWGALCVASCPGGFTKIQTEENGLVCKKSKGCSTIPKCSQCEEKFADICDRCEDGFLLLQQGTGAEVQCVVSCPAGFVKHGTRCRAEMCEDFFCSRCEEGWVLQYKGGTKCLSNCPSGFYRKEDWYSDQAYCDMCRANCKSCQDSYNCDVCEDSFFLLEGVFSKCVETCPVGYLPEKTQSGLGKVCKTDKLGCLDQSCSQCQEGWYRIRIRKVYHCRMECPSGYFGIQQAGKPKICGRCPYNCQECLSPRECRKCKSGLYKLERGGRVHCVWHCPPDYLPDENNNEEKRCVKATDDILGRL